MSAAGPELFRRLVDDAAVFPPGNLPLAEAVPAHLRHRSAPYAGLVGPLLVPVAALAEATALTGEAASAHPVRVGAVARPGTGLAAVLDGLGEADPAVLQVVAVEVPAALDRGQLLETGVPLTVEVRGGEDQSDDLDRIAADRAAGHQVQAKFRTGPTPTWVWPDEAELAAFITAAVARGLTFKLTGGLHHAVRATHPAAADGAPEEQHGLLNVLLAVHLALAGGSAFDVGSVLAERDSSGLVGRIRTLTDDDVAATRAAFTAYGCCGVTDPITELAALGLLEDLPT